MRTNMSTNRRIDSCLNSCSFLTQSFQPLPTPFPFQRGTPGRIFNFFQILKKFKPMGEGGDRLTWQPTDLAISFQCVGFTRGQDPLESKPLKKQLLNPLIN